MYKKVSPSWKYDHKIIHSKPTINVALYELLMDASMQSAGDFIELGTWDGCTFRHIYKKALLYNRTPIAVDSFCGLPEPRMPGQWNMPKGKFDIGGSEGFRGEYPEAVVYEGFIPSVLDDIKERIIAFAHLDLDHELTTKEAIEWVWPRLSDGGIMVCHDFAWGEPTWSPKAIEDWIGTSGVGYVGIQDTSIFFRKGVI